MGIYFSNDDDYFLKDFYARRINEIHSSTFLKKYPVFKEMIEQESTTPALFLCKKILYEEMFQCKKSNRRTNKTNDRQKENQYS